VKKNIVFSEKTGFKAYCDKKYYDVKFLEFLKKDKKPRMPQVTKRLISDSFFANAKAPELAEGGGRFVR
jgi:hypothetical protein